MTEAISESSVHQETIRQLRHGYVATPLANFIAQLDVERQWSGRSVSRCRQ